MTALDFKTNLFVSIILASSVLVVAPTVNAAVIIDNCFESEQKVAHFFEGLEKQDEAFHNFETETRKLIESPDVTLNQIYMILGHEVNYKKLDLKPGDLSAFNNKLHAIATYDRWHTHLNAAETKLNSKGQYCGRVGSESYHYVYKWFLDAEKNILDTKFSITRSW